MLKRNYLLAFFAICLLVLSSCSKDDSDDNPEVTCEDFNVLVVENGSDLATEVAEGTAPFSFIWSTGATTSSITPEESGVFSVTVTDAESCTTSGEIDFELIVVDSCAGFEILLDQNGSDLEVEVTEGTAPFSYVWSTGETTASISPAESGIFSVTVTDAEGCTTLGEIDFEVDGTIPCEDYEILIVENGGDLEVEVNDGIPPFEYAWSTGATTPSITPEENGTFSLTVTDANGCTASAEIEFELVGTTPCEDFEILLIENEGDLVVEVVEGTAPFEYVWSTGATTSTISPEESGVFTVVVSDADGCVGSAEIEFVLVDPCATLSLFLNFINGTLTGEANGGTPPYIFNWSTGEMTPFIIPTQGGEYTLTVVDSEGCTIMESFTIEFPNDLVANIVHDGNGQLTVEASGGVPPYTYQWSTGETSDLITVGDGVYSVTVTDNAGDEVIEEITVMLNPSTCDNNLNLNAENTNTPIMFSAQSVGYLWKGNCDDINPASTFDHYYLVVDITWDSWGTNNPIGIADIADGIPGVSFGSVGIPQVGDVLSPYLETDDYFYNESEGANYDLDEVLITITEISDELGGQIAGTISGLLVSQNNVNDSSTVTGSFCVPIAFVCE